VKDLLEKDIREEILGARSKSAWVNMVHESHERPELIPILFDCLINGESRISRSSAEIIRLISDQDKSVMNPYVNALIDKLNSSCHVAIKRCIFRLFQRTSFTEEQAGKVVEIGFIHLQDHSYSIAVRVFAMTTLYQITKTYPELFDELVAVLSSNLDQESTGFRNRAEKIIARKWK